MIDALFDLNKSGVDVILLVLIGLILPRSSRELTLLNPQRINWLGTVKTRLQTL